MPHDNWKKAQNGHFITKNIFFSVLANITQKTPEDVARENRHKYLMGETKAVGVMFGSKAFVQLLANPLVGILTHRYVLFTLCIFRPYP